MSNITMTPEAFLQYLKRNVLGDVDFDSIAGMNDADKQHLMLRQIDKMIGMQPGADALGWYFTKFLDDDGRCQADNPLTDEASTPLSEWLYDMAELGRLLYWHQAFPLELLAPELEYDPFVDQKLNFTIDNEQLVSWLKVVPYRRVAAMVARIMMSTEYDRIQGCNDAMQDYYAEHCPIGDFDAQDEKQADEFVTAVIDALTEMEQHTERGYELGLDDEQIRVVDMLWSWVPHDYPEEYVAAAKDIVKMIEKLLPAKTVIRSRNGFKLFYDTVLPKLKEIVDKYDVPVDTTDYYNLTMGYMREWMYAKYLGGVVLDEFFD